MRWVGSITQSAADATVMATVKTGLPEGYGIKLAYVRLWFDRMPTYFWATGINDISWDAVVVSDQSGITAQWTGVITAGAAGVRQSTIIEINKEWTLPDFTPVIADTSFTVLLQSDGTAQPNKLNYFIEYKLVELAELELVQILAGAF